MCLQVCVFVYTCIYVCIYFCACIKTPPKQIMRPIIGRPGFFTALRQALSTLSLDTQKSLPQIELAIDSRGVLAMIFRYANTDMRSCMGRYLRAYVRSCMRVCM